jgi:hypothetical protein
MLRASDHVPPSAPSTANNNKRSKSVISLSSSSSSSDSESDSDVKKAKIAVRYFHIPLLTVAELLQSLKAELAVLQKGEGRSMKKREAKGSKNKGRETKRLKKEDPNPGPNKLKEELIDLCSD